MNRYRKDAILITVTEDEKKRIKDLAFKAGLPMTIFCRKILLAQYDKAVNNGKV